MQIIKTLVWMANLINESKHINTLITLDLEPEDHAKAVEELYQYQYNTKSTETGVYINLAGGTYVKINGIGFKIKKKKVR